MIIIMGSIFYALYKMEGYEMKKYESPVVEVEYLNSLDIFTESGGNFDVDQDDEDIL